MQVNGDKRRLEKCPDPAQKCGRLRLHHLPPVPFRAFRGTLEDALKSSERIWQVVNLEASNVLEPIAFYELGIYSFAQVVFTQYPSKLKHLSVRTCSKQDLGFPPSL